jgi:hypothetical protein
VYERVAGLQKGDTNGKSSSSSIFLVLHNKRREKKVKNDL